SPGRLLAVCQNDYASNRRGYQHLTRRAPAQHGQLYSVVGGRRLFHLSKKTRGDERRAFAYKSRGALRSEMRFEDKSTSRPDVHERSFIGLTGVDFEIGYRDCALSAPDQNCFVGTKSGIAD